MPNEFKIRNGLVVEGGSTIITGSLTATGGITGSLLGTASFASTASFVTSASFATTASFVLNTISSSFASTASFIYPLNQNVTLVGNQTITGSLIASSSNATQLQVGSNLLFVSSSGNVGIGTTSPTARLQVLSPSGTLLGRFEYQQTNDDDVFGSRNNYIKIN